MKLFQNSNRLGYVYITKHFWDNESKSDSLPEAKKIILELFNIIEQKESNEHDLYEQYKLLGICKYFDKIIDKNKIPVYRFIISRTNDKLYISRIEKIEKFKNIIVYEDKSTII